MNITRDDLNLIANTIRTLSMDAVEKAKSGHPGMPMGCADIAAVLWTKILRFNPEDPLWPNRDRLVLSAGHGSMLLYAALHLAGYDITLDDIKNFRQWGSRTPGHPEYRHTPGVETTTGPLGQGFANAVGMAMAARMLAEEFNAGGAFPIDHRVYAIVSDGDLMEGISSEAASLAGHMGLGNIIFIYDSNDISIEGSTGLTFSEDVSKKFGAFGWHVQTIDGHDVDAIEKAVLAAQKVTDRPSLVIAKTRIAKGSPGKEGSEESHGAPLGEDEVKKTKAGIGCRADSFCVPDRVYALFAERKKELLVPCGEWNEKFRAFREGDTGAKWGKFFVRPDIAALRKALPSFDPGMKVATRSAGGKVLEVLFRELPGLVGGSADLGPSNKTFVKGFSETGRGKVGRNIHFGIREHAMGAIQNGIAYYGGFIPYSATFFVFLDYMRPPVRLAALCGLKTIYIFTHDSFHVGEDGPTHQPVEHLASARIIPGLTVIRPADAEETREAWLAALGCEGPAALILTRQDIPVIRREAGRGAENLAKGAYVIADTEGTPDIILLATGSEVPLALEAAAELGAKGVKARVVSFPSWELFEKQPEDYRKSVLPENIRRRAVIEAGVRTGWERYAGDGALYVTLDHFGASAPAAVLAEKFGFTKENIVSKIKEYLKR